jgi:hypothetical protein
MYFAQSSTSIDPYAPIALRLGCKATLNFILVVQHLRLCVHVPVCVVSPHVHSSVVDVERKL